MSELFEFYEMSKLTPEEMAQNRKNHDECRRAYHRMQFVFRTHDEFGDDDMSTHVYNTLINHPDFHNLVDQVDKARFRIPVDMQELARAKAALETLYCTIVNQCMASTHNMVEHN
jgi:hypothetical protein